VSDLLQDELPQRKIFFKEKNKSISIKRLKQDKVSEAWFFHGVIFSSSFPKITP